MAKILELAGWKKQVKLFRSPWPFAESSIWKGISRARLRAGLGDSMDVSAKMNWLFLINATRALSAVCKNRVHLSRFSAPALALLLNRDRLISHARGAGRVRVEVALTCRDDTIPGFLFEQTPEGNNQVLALERAKMAAEALVKRRGVIVDLDETPYFLASPPLF